MATTATPAATAELAESSTKPEPIILDLGKKKRKDVRKLRKGKGKLMTKVLDTHAQLSASGVTAPSSQAVIVVVREKPKRRGLW